MCQHPMGGTLRLSKDDNQISHIWFLPSFTYGEKDNLYIIS